MICVVVSATIYDNRFKTALLLYQIAVNCTYMYVMFVLFFLEL